MRREADNLPDFLILGAPKAGTTAIFHALKAHPDVFMPQQKELRFFAFEGKTIEKNDPVNRKAVTDIDTYKRHFSYAKHSQIKGEASPGYLSSADTPVRIKRTVPNVRMIAILRNPIERSFSHFLFAIQQGYEPRNVAFLDALREPYIDYRGFRRLRPYLTDSLYGQSLARYLQIFDRDQIHLVRYEDLKASPQKVLDDISHFLGLDSTVSSAVGTDFAASGVPRNAGLHALLKSRLISWPLKSILGVPKAEEYRATLIGKNLHRPSPSKDEWMRAYELFERDIEMLEDLIGWDCGDWKMYAERVG